MSQDTQIGKPVTEPTIVERSQIILVGFSFFGDPFATSAGWTEENEIGRLWSGMYDSIDLDPCLDACCLIPGGFPRLLAPS